MLFEHIFDIVIRVNDIFGSLSLNLFIIRLYCLVLLEHFQHLFHFIIIDVLHSNYLLYLKFHINSNYFFCLCCFDASARITAAAVDTLNEFTWPYMGMETITSLLCLTSWDTPSPSLPKTMAQPPVKSVS